jgi:hypothetical protein
MASGACSAIELTAAVLSALLMGTLIAFLALLLWGCP